MVIILDRRLETGVSQGGILSPIIFTLFTADLELWCKFSKIYGFADDTTSACQGKNLEEIIQNLKTDADSILSYMASNGLVANPTKTSMVVLNMNKKIREESKISPIEIKIGNSYIKQIHTYIPE